MPFCKGCGHSQAIRAINEALVELQIPPSQVCLVTDIGCVGLADSLFPSIHTVHTTHGRSTAFATGIKTADALLAEQRLRTIVLIGDGGAMIGLQHLVNAALLNVDITVVLCNNFLFGMTGGQNSAFSPYDFVTTTTPRGNIIPPLDLCKIAVDSGAEYVARFLATDKKIGSAIASAILHPGFALVELVELCTEYAVEMNSIEGRQLSRILRTHDQALGLLAQKHSRSEFTDRYRDKYPPHALSSSLFSHSVGGLSAPELGRRLEVVVAGSAGEKVQSSARKLCEGAMAQGLFCTQKNDNPVTQGSGFSLSEIIVSPEEVEFTGIQSPDAVVVVSNDGCHELQERGTFEILTPNSIVVADAEVCPFATQAAVSRLPFRSSFGPQNAALHALDHMLKLMDFQPKLALCQ